MIKYLVVALFALGLSLSAQANITLQATGFSNVLNGNHLYYSNVGNNDGQNWLPANGGPCNEDVNLSCRVPSNNFIFQISDTVPTSGSPKFYIVYPNNGMAPVAGAGTPIGNSGTIISQISYKESGVNSWGYTTMTFGALCNAIVQTGTSTIDGNCNQIAAGAGVYQPADTFTLYVIADANGNGVLDAGESVLPVTFTIQSGIPMYSSQAQQEGFYDFTVLPYVNKKDHGFYIAEGKGSGALSSISGNEGTGIAWVRFFIVEGPDVETQYSLATFNQINFGSLNSIPSYSVEMDSSGNIPTVYLDAEGPYAYFKNGSSYYVRAALQDNAGNTGYLTPASDDSHSAMSPHPHAFKMVW